MASYKETFSAYYDALTEDVDRAVIADRCEELLAQYHPKRELALDLCCGTGTLATELARRGFEVIGVDASPEMLMQAAEKNMALEQPVLYLCHARWNGWTCMVRWTWQCARWIASITLPGKKALQKALHRLQFFVEPGGLFLFDVNTPYKHREVLGNNCFVRESEALFCVWQNEYTPEEHKVEIQMDFFRRGKGEQYTRDGEQFCEWAWEDKELTAMLKAEHFEVLERWGGYDRVPVMPTTQRMVYVARRR